MNIIVVDDEQLALIVSKKAVIQACPDALVKDFTNPYEAIAYASQNGCDIAFLDVNMTKMWGIELAWRLKEMNPDINIIFITAYNEYTLDAMKLRASGYLIKPVTKEDILEEIHNLRYPVVPKNDALITVKTFGTFDVYANGVPVHFIRSKSKEIFAYLIDRNGSGCHNAQIAATVLECNVYDRTVQKNMSKYLGDMIKSLELAGAKDTIIRDRNYYSVNTKLIDCDYFRFLSGDVKSINSFTGEYMSQYSWAEFTVGNIIKKYTESNHNISNR